MSAWWTTVRGVVARHDNQLSAGIRIRFAVTMGGATAEECGLYRRDPAKYPGETNELPRVAARADRGSRAKGTRS